MSMEMSQEKGRAKSLQSSYEAVWVRVRVCVCLCV